MHLNVSSVQWRPFCLSLNVLPSATQKAVRLHWRLLCCIRHYANILLKMLFSDLSAIQVACQCKWSMPAIYSRALLCKTTIQVWSTKYHITPLIFFSTLEPKKQHHKTLWNRMLAWWLFGHRKKLWRGFDIVLYDLSDTISNYAGESQIAM